MACDVACQRTKQLKELLSTLQEATVNKGTAPEAYERARINYYTVKEGQGWLQAEKERTAKQLVKPIVAKYKARYESSRTAPQLVNHEEVGDEAESRFIQDQIEKERNTAGVRQRLMELTSDASPETKWYNYFIDILIAILALVIVYQLLTKYTAMQNYFYPSTFPVT